MSFDLRGSYDCQSAMLFIQVGDSATSVKVTPFINQCALQHTTKFNSDIKARRISMSALVTSQTECKKIETQKARFRISTTSAKLTCANISSKSTSCNELRSKHLKCGKIVHEALSFEHMDCKTADVKKIESDSIGVTTSNCGSLTCTNAEHKTTNSTYVKAKHGLIQNITADVLNLKIEKAFADAETLALNSNFQWEKLQTPSIILDVHGIFAGKQQIQLPFRFQTCTENATCFSKSFLCEEMVGEDASILSAKCQSLQSKSLNCENLNVQTINCRNATIENLKDPVQMQLNCHISDGVFEARVDSNQARCIVPMVQQSTTKDGTTIDAKVAAECIKALYIETDHLATTNLMDVHSKDANIESVRKILCSAIELQDDKHVLRFQTNEAYMCEVPHISLKGDTIYAHEHDQEFDLTLPIKHQRFNDHTHFDNLCIAERLKCLKLKGETSTEILSARQVARLEVNGEVNRQETIGFKCKNLYIDKMCKTTSHELEHLCFDGDTLLIKHAGTVIEMTFPTRHYTSVSDRKTTLESGMRCLQLHSASSLIAKCSANSTGSLQLSVQSLSASTANIQHLKYERLSFDVICVAGHKLHAHTLMEGYKKTNREIIKQMCFEHNVLSINSSSVELPTHHQTFELGTTCFKARVSCNKVHTKTSSNLTSVIDEAEVCTVMAPIVHCDTAKITNLTSVNIKTDCLSVDDKEFPAASSGYLYEHSYNSLCFSEFQLDPKTTNLVQQHDHIILTSIAKHSIYLPVQNITTRDCEISIDGNVTADNLVIKRSSSEHVKTKRVKCEKLRCDVLKGTVIDSDVKCPNFHYNEIQNCQIPKPSTGYLACIAGVIQWLPCLDVSKPHALLAGDRRGIPGLTVVICNSTSSSRKANFVIDGSLETSDSVCHDEVLHITFHRSYEIVLVVYVSQCNHLTINGQEVEYSLHQMDHMVCFHVPVSAQVYWLKFDSSVKVYQINFIFKKYIDGNY